MIKFELYFDEDNNKFVAMNPETGEIKDILIEKKKSTSKKSTSKKTDDNPIPTITLEANKYCLNNAAVELLNVKAGDRIEIRYIHGDACIGKNSAFGTEGGNKMTQSNTVSFRGKNNEELAKYGSTFTLTETEKEGVFKMNGDAPELPKETEEIANPDDIDDLDDLIEDVDDSEIIKDFKFNI